MPKSVITTEQGQELERLKAEYMAATRRAVAAILAHGIQSDDFFRADAEASVAVRRMKEILGTTGKNWMA